MILLVLTNSYKIQFLSSSVAMMFSNIVILVSKLFYKLSKHYYSLEGVTLEFGDKISVDPHWKLYFLATIYRVVRAMVNA